MGKSGFARDRVRHHRSDGSRRVVVDGRRAGSGLWAHHATGRQYERARHRALIFPNAHPVAQRIRFFGFSVLGNLACGAVRVHTPVQTVDGRGWS